METGTGDLEPSAGPPPPPSSPPPSPGAPPLGQSRVRVPASWIDPSLISSEGPTVLSILGMGAVWLGFPTVLPQLPAAAAQPGAEAGPCPHRVGAQPPSLLWPSHFSRSSRLFSLFLSEAGICFEGSGRDTGAVHTPDGPLPWRPAWALWSPRLQQQPQKH